MQARRASALTFLGLVLAAAWFSSGASGAPGRPVPLASAMPRPASPPVSVEAPRAAEMPRATVAFVGDVSMAGGVGAVIKKGQEPAFPFAHVAERLRSYDLLVGNLECVVTSQGEATIPEPLVAPLSAPRLLLTAGFDMVSVANNHTLDMSEAGYFEMLERLDSAGLGHFGTTQASPAREAFVVREVAGVRIALIGHVDRGGPRSQQDVARARERADVVIVFVHWGIEYALTPSKYQREASRALIDAGADAVIAAHAHVVQPAERYRGRLIAHGIGNFVFSGMTRPGSRTGTLVELDVTREGITGHRFVRVAIDDRGAPRFVGEPSEEPSLDPPGPRPLPPMAGE
ncbi:CapA family protein [Polyangium sp. 15x6]|uniref:CapA family protein n=1 Tax=Polyangium sp. 15x6 TaxID=3042687 RepID=UPI00249A4EAA|nr:CapA family protein [Polyangium sp. 15x6]MDI3282621.1 CapA family protein [Polyangium sp. 15x6]